MGHWHRFSIFHQLEQKTSVYFETALRAVRRNLAAVGWIAAHISH
jgi:hypothetical protein